MDQSFFQETLKRAKDGQRPALTTLYATYNPMLLRLLRAQAPGVGEDLAQETWLAAAPRLSKFRGDERAFRMWLLTIAREQAAEYKRSSGRVPTTYMTPRALNGVTRHATIGDATVGDAALAQLLAGLSATHAEILLLRVVGGLTADETAALVGKSAGAVRVIQHRTLRQLAQRLSEQQVGA